MSDPVAFAPYIAATQPDLDSPAYVGTRKRHPMHAPVKLPQTITETTGPRFSTAHFPPLADLSRRDGRAALGDRHDAPLDPNFHGDGRVFTDAEGRYRFMTVKPGAYPWPNHHNAWRPNHIHYSLFGPAFATRLITQMYFPGDPLLEIDPIFQSVPDAAARARLVSRFDIALTEPDYALGYRFDFVLRGRSATPMEH
jgi:protocatechuate 3,4-dioxygenase beta subunit